MLDTSVSHLSISVICLKLDNDKSLQVINSHNAKFSD